MARRIVLPLFFSLTLLLAAAAAASAEKQPAAAIEVTVYPSPGPLPVVVDGRVYIVPAGGKAVIPVDTAGPHRVRVAETVIYTGQGARLVFQGWSGVTDSPEAVVRAPAALVALYRREYLVEVSTPYGGGGLAGWYPEGARVAFSVEPVVDMGNGTRMVFTSWSGGVSPGSPSNYIYVLQPVRVEARWQRQYLLRVEGGHAAGTGWYPQGARAEVQAEPVIEAGSGARMRFTRWEVAEGNAVVENPQSPSTRVRVEGPATVKPVYTREYLVEVDAVHGDPLGAGWYPEGAKARIASKQAVVPAGPGARYLLTGWRINGRETKATEPSVVVDAPIHAEALWQLQYQLVVDTKVDAVKGAGWYPAGAKAVLEATATLETPLGAATVFKGWRGDASGTNPTVTLEMDAPKKVAALWEKSYTGVYERLAAATTAMAGAYLAYRLLAPRLLHRRRGEQAA